MTMSTQTLVEAGRLLRLAVLVDRIAVYDVGDPVTVGTAVTRELTILGTIEGLVQTTTLTNAVESKVDNVYSVKFAKGRTIYAGQAIKVVSCVDEPDLVGKMLLLDKVSHNGLSMIRKATASDFEVVNQEGKGGIA